MVKGDSRNRVKVGSRVVDTPRAICKYQSSMSNRSESANHHYDEKLRQILKTSAKIFAEKGFHRTSVRDIARATRMSLAGLYYTSPPRKNLLNPIKNNSF